MFNKAIKYITFLMWCRKMNLALPKGWYSIKGFLEHIK